MRARDSNRDIDLAVGHPIVPAHTGRAIGRSREHSIGGSHAHGAAFPPVAGCGSRRADVRTPGIALDRANGGAGEVFVPACGAIDAIANLTERAAHAEFQRVRSEFVRQRVALVIC